MMEETFRSLFSALTGNRHFPWQWALYQKFAEGNFLSSCDLPTGLGKTSVIALWLIALAHHPDRLPRRLVYVVNRRTVVDQTTAEVEKLRANLRHAGLLDRLRQLCAIPLEEDEPPLAVSTLRGQFADNREWSADPCRPAVICGTVDMIGSRLLFSGYGIGFKGRPLHAGFLGQDVLLVHDEAHLEPAFQRLIETIRGEQVRCKDFRPLQVMELTATSRGNNETFGLMDEDWNNQIVLRRINAKKALHLHQLDDGKKLADKLAAQAKKFEDKNRAVLVFARTVEDVLKIADKLPKGRVVTLTGTMRGKERDDLVKDPLFKRFLPGGQSDEPTTYLVCTSAGEVGVNISADHLVCDLTPFDSMAQRFGRVNRFGQRFDTKIHVFHPKKEDFKDEDNYEQVCAKTLELLGKLNGEASPAALGQLDSTERQAAFTSTSTILPATDILFDAWVLTTIRAFNVRQLHRSAQYIPATEYVNDKLLDEPADQKTRDNRLSDDGFRPVPPLSAFRVVGYRRVTDPPPPRWVAFRLRHPTEDRSAVFAQTRANQVAAMTRNATARVAGQQGQPQEWIDRYVHGHRHKGEEESLPRFSYLPLPTIERRGQGHGVLGAIRRLIVAELVESAESHWLWAWQMLPGQFLTDDKTGERKAMLAQLTNKDWVLQCYVGRSDTWATVTPVVLPGSDEGKRAKAEKLFFKALRHAGYSPDALAELEFRNVSFWPGGDLALRFQRPDYLKKACWSVYHVRLRWQQEVTGPIALGAGRHCGLGIFAIFATGGR